MARYKPKSAKKSIAKECSEIILLLDGYDDIFSDFDPRPYSERAMSEDFLHEAKNASLDKNHCLELNFLIPKKERKLNQEVLIKKRLKAHFIRHYELLKKDKKHLIFNHGLLFIILGIIIMFISTWVLFTYDSKTLFITFLVIVLEPAGWFLFWEGLNMAIFESKKIDPDLQFYEKMSKCTITFTPIK